MNSNQDTPHNWPILRRRDTPEPTDIDRVGHMLGAIDRLDEVLGRFTLAELLGQELPQSSGCRHFGILGTAAGATSVAFQLVYPDVAWNRWKRYGRSLIRNYDRVNYKLMRQKWQHEMPVLRMQLQKILVAENAD